MKGISILLILACAMAIPARAGAEEITVAAAADLNFALQDLAARYTKATGTQVRLSFGASGNLFSQIQNGAPFDVFFSADADYPKKLADVGLVDATLLRTYAIGHLVLWAPKSSSLDPQKLKMDLLTSPEVKRIAIANPQHAPYGRAAMAALEHFGLKDKVGVEAGDGREHQPGSAVRAVGQRTGGPDCAVAGALADHEEQRAILGASCGFLS